MVKVSWDQKVWEWLLQDSKKVNEGDEHCIEGLGNNIIQSTCPCNNHFILGKAWKLKCLLKLKRDIFLWLEELFILWFQLIKHITSETFKKIHTYLSPQLISPLVLHVSVNSPESAHFFPLLLLLFLNQAPIIAYLFNNNGTLTGFQASTLTSFRIISTQQADIYVAARVILLKFK